jgi:tetratricopeptide (TPR) repeat protein
MHTNTIRIVFLLVLVIAPNIALARPKESDTAYYNRKYEAAMAKLNSATDEDSRFHTLNNAAKYSLDQGHDADAKSFAEELERLAPKYMLDWNYGNAVQDFNIVLGRLALKAGDVETAKKRLLAAGHSPGSPTMDTFGPNMTLAKELLAQKEKAVVLEYFELCRKFWENHDDTLEQWKKDVEHNRIPDFGSNLHY